MKNLETLYTKHGRLSDILSLIQVLALDKHSHRSEAGIVEELRKKPSSAETWSAVANQHPEFFRVRETGEHVISLVARHVLEKESAHRPVLSSEFIQTLISTAIDLHDREQQRADRWTAAIPIIAALIAGTFALIALTLKAYLGSPN